MFSAKVCCATPTTLAKGNVHLEVEIVIGMRHNQRSDTRHMWLSARTVLLAPELDGAAMLTSDAGGLKPSSWTVISVYTEDSMFVRCDDEARFGADSS